MVLLGCLALHEVNAKQERLSGHSELNPDEHGWVQLLLASIRLAPQKYESLSAHVVKPKHDILRGQSELIPLGHAISQEAEASSKLVPQ